MENKKISINFSNFWNGFDVHNNLIVDSLSQNYIVEVSDFPEYLFISCFGKEYEYLKFDGIRIFYSGENYSPDFNLVDYAIGFDNLKYEDRFYQYKFGYPEKTQEPLYLASKNIKKDILKDKTYFCNFIYSHKSKFGERENILELLNKYKRVECAGSFLNNMTNSTAMQGLNYSDKLDFQKKCKFTIAVESTSISGFHTEKLIHAFISNTVPIYYGDPNIGSIFNTKAFVNIHDFASFEDALVKIKEIDENDELYMDMLRQNPLINEDYPVEKYNGLADFLKNIIEQPYEKAYRRSRCYLPAIFEEKMKYCNRLLSKEGKFANLARRFLTIKIK